MNTLKSMVYFVFMVNFVFIYGCNTGKEGNINNNSESTPLSEYIYQNKTSLVRTSEKMLFEEFVRYKEFSVKNQDEKSPKGTFALYLIKDSSIEVNTTISKSSEHQGGIEVGYPLGVSLSGTTNIEVKNDQAGKMTIQLVPIGNDPATYKAIKKIFDSTRSNDIYSLESRAQCPDIKKDLSGRYVYCYRIAETADTDGSSNYAIMSLEQYKNFRAMVGKIREL